MKDNKLIAEFMGMKYSDERSFDNGEWTHTIKSLSKFQTDWNWLMPVVRETLTTIELDNLDYDTRELRYNTLDCDIDGTYKEVVEFIKLKQD